MSRGGRIVDLGCGSGQLLAELENQFDERIGLDVSRQRLDEKKSEQFDGWVFHEADLNSRFPLEDEYTDAIIANQVIEHILDPVQFVKEIHRILRPRGRCVITTPNIRYSKHIAHLLFSGYGPRTAGGNTLDGQWDDGHIHYFTHKDLRELFEQAGFSEVRSCGHVNEPHSNLLRRMLDAAANEYPVREFLSGCILLWAVK